MSSQNSSLYVGDLADNVSDRDLYEAFKEYGTISGVQVCRDTYTKKSLGYGYVNFATREEAQKAMDEMNYNPLTHDGKNCRIMWVNKDPTMRKTGVGNVYIKGLAEDITERDLYTTFSQLGAIVSCKVARDMNGNSRGYGFVHFEDPKIAEVAIEKVNGKPLADKIVTLEKFIPRAERLRNKLTSWTNVFVKEIPDSVNTTEKLCELFSEFGEITSPKLMTDADGNTRGFGFIAFAEHDSADRAVKEMHQKEVDGKVLYVSRAQSKAERRRHLEKEYQKRRRQNQQEWQGRNLYIKNIADGVTEKELVEAFQEFGETASVVIMRDRATNVSRGFGFVSFLKKEDAQTAIEKMHDSSLPGYSDKKLYVQMHEPKEERIRRITRAKREKLAMRSYPAYGAPMYSVPPQSYPPAMRPPMQPQQPDLLAVFKQDQVKGKELLGEQLYMRVNAKLKNPELSSKITGMFIGANWPVEQKVSLLNDDTALEKAVQNASKVLQQQSE